MLHKTPLFDLEKISKFKSWWEMFDVIFPGGFSYAARNWWADRRNDKP